MLENSGMSISLGTELKYRSAESSAVVLSVYLFTLLKIQYESARGHTFVVEDVTNTGRPHKLANCFTCKTSDFTAKALNDGDSAYSMAFEDMEAQITDSFGCFHCHQNEPGTLYVTHTYLANALADDIGSQNAQTLSCAQCHSEYYFDPETKATTLGYTGIENATPDKILDYYNNLLDAEGNPYADWVDETTGVRKLKTQHPEFETISAAGGIHPDMSCVTCHMGKATAEDGTEYTNHYWTSPLDNPEILESCNTCHGDIASAVEAIHTDIMGRCNTIGEDLAKANENLAAAVEAGTLSEEDLAKASLLEGEERVLRSSLLLGLRLRRTASTKQRSISANSTACSAHKRFYQKSGLPDNGGPFNLISELRKTGRHGIILCNVQRRIFNSVYLQRGKFI